MPVIAVVSTTLPSRAKARTLARTIVGERLAACAQIHGPITSIYRWKGKVESAREWRCDLKTTARRWPVLRRRISALHPYDVPEIVMVRAQASPAYARWVAGEVRGER